ncbi:piggyBac transposable element-derived protein 4-like [Trichonephila clavipes]|nr:piggyBac transposable element-derived protein 4-like [Trichonephila clavipes]
MPSKPDKFGIKFWLAADINCKYLLNGFPHLYKYEERPINLLLSEYIVLRLIGPFRNKARNITTNNFFITLNLSQMLKTKNTSLIGTTSTSICEESKDCEDPPGSHPGHQD